MNNLQSNSHASKAQPFGILALVSHCYRVIFKRFDRCAQFTCSVRSRAGRNAAGSFIDDRIRDFNIRARTISFRLRVAFDISEFFAVEARRIHHEIARRYIRCLSKISLTVYFVISDFLLSNDRCLIVFGE
jgi:hypothetical protein